MIGSLFTLQLLLKGIAVPEINAGWADHLVAKPTHAAEIGWVAFRLDDDDFVAVGTGKGIRLLADAAYIKREGVASRPEHYCSSK